MDLNRCHIGDCRDTLRRMAADGVRVQMCVTSPPYWGLRDYGVEGQLGLEATPEEYIANMVEVFRLVRDVLADDGTCWINLGSSYASSSGMRSNQSRGDVPAYDSDGTAPQDSQDVGYVYLGLCDECLAGYQNHLRYTENSDQPYGQSQQQPETIGRDNERPDSVAITVDVGLLSSPVSTTLESWLQLRGECSRCDSRVSSLLELDSSALDVQAYAHRKASRNGKTQTADSSAIRIEGKEPSSMAWEHYTSTLKPKDMIPTPWMLAMALQADGWYLRSDIIWHKPNAMPESCTDRPAKSHEYLFLLSKRANYYYDSIAVQERSNGRDNHARGSGEMEAIREREGVPRAVSKISEEASSAEEVLRKRQGSESNRTLSPNHEGAGMPVARGSQTPLSDDEYPIHTDSTGMGINQGAPELQMYDVRHGADALDSRSHYCAEQGRAPYKEQYSGALPELQQSEKRPITTTTRNLRTVWTIATQPYSEAHFATFPQKLVEPCVLAGTSERGHCPECGERWERMVEREKPPEEAFNKARVMVDENVKMSPLHRSGKASGQKMQDWLDAHPAKTLGWIPACHHGLDGLDPVPDVVLDPFFGSGTVGQVAENLGRSWIGLELNPEYVKMSEKRTAQMGMAL